MINNESAVAEEDMAGLNESGKPILRPPSRLDLIKLRRSNVCCAFISIQLYRTALASRSLYLVAPTRQAVILLLMSYYEVVLRLNWRHRRAAGHFDGNIQNGQCTLSETIP